MRKLNLTVLTFLILTNSFGQKIEKIYLDKNDSTSNSYLVIYPTKLQWNGFLILIPGFSETPEGVLLQTDLSKIAAEHGILTIIPTLKTGVKSFGIDSLSQQSFKEIIEDVASKYKLVDLKFYLGGFSIGGSCVLKFTELAIKDNFKYKPNAVFVIDSPLDFENYSPFLGPLVVFS